MQQKLTQQINIELLAYIEPLPEERTWCIYECVPFGDSWKRLKDHSGDFVCGCYHRKKLNPTIDEDIDLE